jgi:hypothetical protein
MAETVQSILKKLPTVTQTASEADLKALVVGIAENQSDSALQNYFRSLLGRIGPDTACQINVLAAGLFGVLPGHATLTPDSGKVNGFLHKLRKAILAAEKLNEKMKVNATQYIFYPEFVTAYPALRERIAALALAHAGMGKSSDELTVLYSLGGYFSEKEAGDWSKSIGPSAGTTCVMTARAVYQAAGARMIGQRVPKVTTPTGPVIDLGVPTIKVSKGTNQKYPQATVNRDGMAPVAADTPPPKPQLQVGDIYMVEGDSDHPFLLRGGGALAPHVGIITAAGASDRYNTVDGGQGSGGDVGKHENRKLEQTATGWTFSDQTRSYSQADIDKVNKDMKQYDDESKIDQYIATQPDLNANLNSLKPQYAKQISDGNAVLAMRILSQMNFVRDLARKRIRLAEGETVGAKRIIHGWWKPESYGQMTVPALDALGRTLPKAA